MHISISISNNWPFFLLLYIEMLYKKFNVFVHYV